MKLAHLMWKALKSPSISFSNVNFLTIMHSIVASEPRVQPCVTTTLICREQQGSEMTLSYTYYSITKLLVLRYIFFPLDEGETQFKVAQC